MHRGPATDDVFDALVHVVYDLDPPPVHLADGVTRIIHLDIMAESMSGEVGSDE